MENTTELRKELSEIFVQLKARKIDTPAAKAFYTIANATLKSAAIEADYNKFLGKKKPIKFITTPER